MNLIENVLRNAILLKPKENVLIIFDEEKEKIANLFFKSCEKIGAEVYSSKIKIRRETKREPPFAIKEAMKFSDVVLAITSISLTHTKAVREARRHGARIATMPGINEKMFPTLNVNYKKLAEECNKFSKIFEKTKEIRVKTKLGTDLILRKGKRKVQVDDGILDKPGSLHNLPTGEVGIAPIENSANGKIVFDVCMVGIGKIKTPIKVEVKNGKIIKIFGGNEAKKLKNIFKKADKNAKILCEFSIGMNRRAKIIGEVLNDEKAFGTCHVAFGDNKSIGGRNGSKVHLDGVIKKPTILFDSKLIMKNGKLI
ncbi:MAG: aminopeptidase [Candidatus Aenigmatarchaeota archaeon]